MTSLLARLSRRLPLDRTLLASIIVVQLILGTALLLTRAPHSDEGTFGNAAYLLATKGYLGMPTLDPPAGHWLAGIDRHMYWNMPLYMIVVAGWFKLFGVSLFGERFVSLLFCALATLAWYVVIRCLTRDRAAALLGAALIGLNYDLFVVGTGGRTDMMCAGLYASGMAAYLALRERNLFAAILVSQSLLACSLLTHPYAAFGILATLVFALVYDRSRLRWSFLGAAAAPYALAIGAWLIYAAQAPAIARAQLLGNVAAGRINSFAAPLHALRREIAERYIVLAGGFRSHVPVAMRLRLLVFLAYLAAFCGGLLPSFRRRPGHALLLSLMGIDFLLLTYFENLKWYVYLIHVIPVYAAVLALFLVWLWRDRRVPRAVPVLAAAGFLLFNVGSIAYRVRIDSYKNAYLPAARFLLHAARPGELIMGSSQFAHAFHFNGQVLEDYTLGFESRKNPVFIVVESQVQGWFDTYERTRPDIIAHIRRQLGARALLFTVKCSNESYQIYGPPDRKPRAATDAR
jgi:4-amino-4-deoxy-L-arabinose transferase-like glycosyltransferase